MRTRERSREIRGRVASALAGLAVVAVAFGGSACVDRMTVRTVMPSMLRDDDLDKACRAATALEPPLESIRVGGKQALRALSLSLVTSGMCAEREAWEAELEGLRAEHDSRHAPWRAAAFQDATLREKRLRAVAGGRYLRAWEFMVERFGDPDSGSCPKLGADDGLAHALGLTAGVLAFSHQGGSGTYLGVPDTVPAAAAAGAACVDDERFWGLGSALRGALWASIPGTAPEGTDPWVVLEGAVAKGDAAGVLLARAFQIVAAVPRDDGPDACALLDAFATAQEKPGAPGYRMLNVYAAALVQHEVDRRWIRARGHRAPYAGAGCPQGEPVLPPIAEDPPPPQAGGGEPPLPVE